MKIAVCIHNFYDDKTAEILNRLKFIERDFVLFITGPKAPAPYLLSILNTTFARIWKYYSTENDGRDIKPFFRLLNDQVLKPYDLILKLHSKRDMPCTGSLWRDVTLDALLRDQETTEAIISAFETNPCLQIVGPKDFYKSGAKLQFASKANVSLIKSRLGVSADEWGFFAGTMFWARKSLFTPILPIESSLTYEYECGAPDGQMVHALERVLAIAVKPSDLVGLIPPTGGLEIVQGIGDPSQELMSKTLARLAESNH